MKIPRFPFALLALSPSPTPIPLGPAGFYLTTTESDGRVWRPVYRRRSGQYGMLVASRPGDAQGDWHSCGAVEPESGLDAPPIAHSEARSAAASVDGDGAEVPRLLSCVGRGREGHRDGEDPVELRHPLVRMWVEWSRYGLAEGISRAYYSNKLIFLSVIEFTGPAMSLPSQPR